MEQWTKLSSLRQKLPYYVKNKTEEVLLNLGITQVGHDDGIFEKVADIGSNVVEGWRSLACIDHTIERSVRMLWLEPKVKYALTKTRTWVVTFCVTDTHQHIDRC